VRIKRVVGRERSEEGERAAAWPVGGAARAAE
jgi:hypothetical protein